MGWLLDWRGFVTNVCAKAFIIYVRVAVPAPNVLAADAFGTVIIH